MIVSPENSVPVVELQTTGHWRTVNTGAETDGRGKQWSPVCCVLPALVLGGGESLPGVGVGREDDRDVCGDIDDAVLGLNAHPTQLDVLRVSRAHLCVVLHRKQ